MPDFLTARTVRIPPRPFDPKKPSLR